MRQFERPETESGPATRRDLTGPVGNVYDKFHTKNPLARRLVAGFLSAVHDLYRRVDAGSVLEVGCGEGRLSDHLIRRGPRPETFHALDLSVSRVPPDVDPQIRFREGTIYDLPYGADRFDLVLCCEVLEHLSDPAAGLMETARVARRAVILSTPWEPVWRMLNVARGKYLRDLGNTPGHLQHFGRRGLLRLAERSLEVVDRRTPLPWTILLGVPRA